MLEEKRSEVRYDKSLVVVGIVTHCDGDRSLNGSPVRCETVDISGHGMKFRSDIELPVETLLTISVAYTVREILQVRARVRWCNMAEGQPLIGVRLIEEKDSDFEKWVLLLQSGLE
ncbi:MAG: hypothetical protein GKR91_12770 [Pseudomonadales bacterium]|nr:hypothetical protein [Pseudomonadales bacterium]